MRCYETMRSLAPDFFIHSGEYRLLRTTDPGRGPNWTMARFWAATLVTGGEVEGVFFGGRAEGTRCPKFFPGANFKYNLLDATSLAFNAEVPMMAQWDDHDGSSNNWYPGEMLERRRPLFGQERPRCWRPGPIAAFHEFNADRPTVGDPGAGSNRQVPYGPHLDVFFLGHANLPCARNGPERPGSGRPRATTSWAAEQGPVAESKARGLSGRQWKVIEQATSDRHGGSMMTGRKQGEPSRTGANANGPVRGREDTNSPTLLRSFPRCRHPQHRSADRRRALHAGPTTNDPNQRSSGSSRRSGNSCRGDPHAEIVRSETTWTNTFGPQVMYSKAPDGVKPAARLRAMQFSAMSPSDGRHRRHDRDAEGPAERRSLCRAVRSDDGPKARRFEMVPRSCRRMVIDGNGARGTLGGPANPGRGRQEDGLQRNQRSRRHRAGTLDLTIWNQPHRALNGHRPGVRFCGPRPNRRLGCGAGRTVPLGAICWTWQVAVEILA